ncbi:MAG: protein-export chaperone SecB [Armatimonadetes bacterium]|nr:protein-export chaperone SecB [Armatimonadota bacterium]
MISALQLRAFYIEELHVEARPCTDGEFEPNEHEDYQVSLEQEMSKVPEHQKYMLVMKLGLEAKDEDRTPPAALRSLAVTARGFFDLPDDAPEEYVEKVVPLNCSAILYGMLRGVVSQVTANLPSGPQLLPTLNLAEALSEQAGGMADSEDANARSPAED